MAKPNINPDHAVLLGSGLQAPSAHNTQPWQIIPSGDNTYDLHYIQSDALPHDPDDKDAYLTMGAMVETLALQAPNRGLQVSVRPELTRDGEDIFMAQVAIDDLPADAVLDPLSMLVGKRHTNRNKYTKAPLSPELRTQLRALGNTVIDTQSLTDVVRDASAAVWTDPEYVKDLQTWFRPDNSAEDGITPAPFNITKSDMAALKFAFWRGGFKSRTLGAAYSKKDVDVFASGPSAAVMGVTEKTPEAMFTAGRNLLRSWVTVNGAGFDYQPYSVAVDDPAAAERVAQIARVENPIALYRIGKAAKPPQGYSNRKPLSSVTHTV